MLQKQLYCIFAKRVLRFSHFFLWEKLLTETWYRHMRIRSATRRRNFFAPELLLRLGSPHTLHTPTTPETENELQEIVEHEAGKE